VRAEATFLRGDGNGTVKRSTRQHLRDLYTAHAAGLRRMAYLMTGDVDEAEDLLQEAFTRLGGRLFTLRDPARASGYLYRTIINLARDHGRRLSRDRALKERLSPTSASLSAEPYERADVWDALMELPIRHRAVLFLRYFMDLSEDQTAELLGCSVSAVKSLNHRASTSLRKRLEGRPT
jgi:RNA polymerase sigma-70 factor (sigma-E family)